MGRRYRLAVLAPHPVAYHVPFYRTLAAHPSVDLTVFYCSRLGISGERDPEFGIPLKWGISLLDGYRHQFFRNFSPWPAAGRFFSLINPGIFPALMKGRYDAVIIPGYSSVSYLFGFCAAWIFGIPVFFRGETVLRTQRSKIRSILIERILRGTRACLAIGVPSRAFYRAHRVPEERIFSSPYGVDNEFFYRESRGWASEKPKWKQSLSIPSEVPIVLFCGKLIPRKRPGDLLSAFLRLRCPAALVFVGDGALRSSLEQQAAGHSRVIFTGFVSQAELPKYYALADIFVLPSERETVAVVVAEAMACGLPLILSDAVPSVVDFVKSGENGLVFPLGDMEALQRHLECLLSDEGLRRRMGQQSIALSQQQTPQKSAAGVLKALGVRDEDDQTYYKPV